MRVEAAVRPAALQRLLGLSSFSNANYCATQSGGGEAGVVTGFGGAALVQVTSVQSSANLAIMGRDLGVLGWLLYVGSGSFIGAISNGTGFVSTPARQIVPSDVGKIFLVMLAHTGAGNLARLYVDRIERGSGTAISGYASASTPSMIGKNGQGMIGAYPTLAEMAFRGVPTLAQIQAYYDAARVLGDLPDTIQGATVTHHVSLKRALAGTVPVSGQAAPGAIVDNITGASADAMARQGSPTVVVIDPTVERTWSYETSPILYGHAPSTSPADYYATVATPSFLLNVAGLFWLAWIVRFDSQATSTTRVLGSTYNTAGALLQTLLTNSTLSFLATDSGGVNRTTPAAVIGSPDTGKLGLVVAVHDGSAIRLYWKRAQVGTGTSCAGFTPSAQPLYIGRDPRGFSADSTSVFGISGGSFANTVSAPSLAEIQALHDDVLAYEDIRGIPGKTAMLCSYKQAVRAAGGSLPAQISDLVGANHLVRGGNPNLATSYARAWEW